MSENKQPPKKFKEYFDDLFDRRPRLSWIAGIFSALTVVITFIASILSSAADGSDLSDRSGSQAVPTTSVVETTTLPVATTAIETTTAAASTNRVNINLYGKEIIITSEGSISVDITD